MADKRQQWCIDPRHGTPCPEPCVACAEECDEPRFLGTLAAAEAELAAAQRALRALPRTADGKLLNVGDHVGALYPGGSGVIGVVQSIRGGIVAIKDDDVPVIKIVPIKDVWSFDATRAWGETLEERSERERSE